MLNLPRQTLEKIKQVLRRQQKEVENQLQEIEHEDPVVFASEVAEAPESGTESWMAEVHGRLGSLRKDLLALSEKIKKSLFKLNRGTYGRCEGCGNMIEADRLEALPSATLCLACSFKK